jgi:hypothetical protein
MLIALLEDWDERKKHSMDPGLHHANHPFKYPMKSQAQRKRIKK